MGRTREMTRSPAERATGGKLEFEPIITSRLLKGQGPADLCFKAGILALRVFGCHKEAVGKNSLLAVFRLLGNSEKWELGPSYGGWPLVSLKLVELFT